MVEVEVHLHRQLRSSLPPTPPALPPAVVVVVVMEVVVWSTVTVPLHPPPVVQEAIDNLEVEEVEVKCRNTTTKTTNVSLI